MSTPSFGKRFVRALSFPLVVIAAFVLWLEEWLWEPLGECMRWLGGLPPIRRIEHLIRHAPPAIALACFAIPVIALLPFKLAGLWLLGKGQVIPGISVFLSAKVVGTALAARIFTLTRPQLMGLGWFARLWRGYTALRERLYARVKAHPAWILIHEGVAALRAWLRAFGG